MKSRSRSTITDLSALIAMVGCLLTLILLSCSQESRTPLSVRFPPDQTGWFSIAYGVSAAEPLPRVSGRYLADFRQSRRLSTSTTYQSGWARDVYEQVIYGTLQQLNNDSPRIGVQDRLTVFDDQMPGIEAVEWFFVGTREQLKAQPSPPG